MSIRIRLTEGSSPGLQATDAGTLPPGFPFSVSVWFRIDTDDDTGAQILWWYGDGSSTGNSLLLQFNNTNERLELDAGSAYSTIATIQSAATVSRYEWHLVTIVAEYNGSTTLTHTMYIDAAVSPQSPVSANKTGTTTTPPTNDWDRVTIGRRDDSPIRPLDGYVEQLAIWDAHAVSLSDHQKMWSDSSFDNLRRPPSVVGTQPNIAWWMLTGHHRHSLKIDQNDPQQSGSKDFGELVNFVNVGGDPALESILDPEEDPVPTWSVESPLVYYPPETVGDYPTRPPKHAPHRCFPRFVIYQKPELFTPWNGVGMEGKHPLYDDPNWVVLSRIAFNQVNNDNRSPPVFEDVDYVPQSYVTNVARRIADWFEYQGFWGPTTMVRADDDPEPGSLFVQTLGTQFDSAFKKVPDPPNPGAWPGCDVLMCHDLSGLTPPGRPESRAALGTVFKFTLRAA